MACCSSLHFLSFFLWFWKPASEKKKPIVMLVLSSVGFLFPRPPLCLCSQRKKETLWFLLLAIAEDDDSVEGLSHQHCHCLLSSVLFFFNSPFSPWFLFLFVSFASLYLSSVLLFSPLPPDLLFFCLWFSGPISPSFPQFFFCSALSIPVLCRSWLL